MSDFKSTQKTVLQHDKELKFPHVIQHFRLHLNAAASALGHWAASGLWTCACSALLHIRHWWDSTLFCFTSAGLSGWTVWFRSHLQMVQDAGALPGVSKQFVSKGYRLWEAAPLLFVVTSGRASRWISTSRRRWRSSSESMLRAGRMEEFVTEEEEPWYDQRDLEQGEASCLCRVSGLCLFVCVWVGGGSEGVTMPHPQSLYPGIKGFLQGEAGWKEERRMHPL